VGCDLQCNVAFEQTWHTYQSITGKGNIDRGVACSTVTGAQIFIYNRVCNGKSVMAKYADGHVGL